MTIPKNSAQITGDPYCANAIDHLRAAGIETEALNWIETKSDEQVRAEIHLMQKQYRKTGERQAFIRADALLDGLNARIRIKAEVAALRARIEAEEGGDS